jgi:hypothetical protein
MILLYLIKLLHILNEIFVSTYVFIFDKKYDKYFMTYLVLTMLHWLILKNECILSYIEKKILDKNYVLGSSPYYHPFHSNLTPFILKLFEILKIINVSVIYIRNYNNLYISILVFMLILFYIFKK